MMMIADGGLGDWEGGGLKTPKICWHYMQSALLSKDILATSFWQQRRTALLYAIHSQIPTIQCPFFLAVIISFMQSVAPTTVIKFTRSNIHPFWLMCLLYDHNVAVWLKWPRWYSLRGGEISGVCRKLVSENGKGITSGERGVGKARGRAEVNLLVPIPQQRPRNQAITNQVFNHLTFQLEWATAFQLPNKSMFVCSSNRTCKVKWILNETCKAQMCNPESLVEAIGVWTKAGVTAKELLSFGPDWLIYLKTTVKLTCIECVGGFKGQYIKIWNPNCKCHIVTPRHRNWTEK